MNSHIKIARELVKMAKQLIEAAPTGTYDSFDKLSQSNIERNYANEVSDDFPWKLFSTDEEVEAFIKKKSEQHPNLFEVISEESLKNLLDNGWFCIVSAGVNPEEDNECRKNATNENGILDNVKYKHLKHNIVDERDNELCEFLDKLNVSYYECVGQYGSVAEKSYIVDLTNIGKNNKEEAKSLFRQISSFCGNQLKQESIMEGIGSQHAIVFCKDRSHLKRIDDNGEYSKAMTQVYHDIKDRTKNTTKSSNFGELHSTDWLDEK